MLSALQTADARTDPTTAALVKLAKPRTGEAGTGPGEFKDKFQEFVAGTFYQSMIKAMRDTQKPSKYFYGGQAEKIFTKQLDEQFARELAAESGDRLSGPLFELYSQQLQQKDSLEKADKENSHVLDIVA
jgi:Rod binding domain-containing protein